MITHKNESLGNDGWILSGRSLANNEGSSDRHFEEWLLSNYEWMSSGKSLDYNEGWSVGRFEEWSLSNDEWNIVGTITGNNEGWSDGCFEQWLLGNNEGMWRRSLVTMKAYQMDALKNIRWETITECSRYGHLVTTMNDDQSDAFYKNDCWALTNEYCCDDHLVIMKAHQLDALKNDCLGTMTGCCNDDHFVIMMADQMDALTLKNDCWECRRDDRS